jgi:hemoglobin/transferrin/lactoferrin receptor protein
MRALLFFLFIASGSAAAFSQTVTVRDAATRLPISGVKALGYAAQPGEYTATSSPLGTLECPWLSSVDSLQFSHPDYHSLTLRSADLTDGTTLLLTETAFATEEIVVAADRSGEAWETVPAQLQVITGRQIRFQNAPTPAHVLEQQGQVWVQRSQLGGGSPVLRGFEASRVLLVVDGVRMNNAIFRTGHLQNILGVDANLLDRVETVFGPGAVAYGSDALGGVVSLFTRRPVLGAQGQPHIRTNALARYASAADEFTMHADVNLGFAKFASLTSVTVATYGDLRQGREQSPFWGNFGRRPYYQTRIDGRDSAMANPKPWVQVGTGYSQLNIAQRLLFAPSPRQQHSLNLQLNTTTDVPRYDRLTERAATDTVGNRLSHAEWYYGPETRLQATYGFTHYSTPAYDRLEVLASYQHFQESRHNRRWNNAWRTDRTENVDVLSLFAQAEKTLRYGSVDEAHFNQHGMIPIHKLYYGLEAQHNTVNSTAIGVNVNRDTTRAASTRYPDGGSTLGSYAAFVRHEWVVARWLHLGSGARFTHTRLNAKFVNKEFYGFLPDAYANANSALSGSLNAVVMPTRRWSLIATLASGFRAPNVDDLGKIFDSSPGTVILPNTAIRPEQTLTAELGTRLQLGRAIRFQGHVYYTQLFDFLAARPATVNGQDSMLYDNVMSRIFQIQNTDRGRIVGGFAQVEAELAPGLGSRQTFNYTFGEVLGQPRYTPLDHIPPTFGGSYLTYSRSRLQVMGYLLFNGWKRIKHYSASGEDNAQYALPQGTPAWYTLNLKLSYAPAKWLQVQAGCENILDVHYRVFASGISAPGRNFILALRASF